MSFDTLAGSIPRGRSRWWLLFIVVCIALTIWCIADVRRRARADGRKPHSTDFTVYTEAGAAFFDGRDPYTVTNPRGWRYLYPPLFAILVAPAYIMSSTACSFKVKLLGAWGLGTLLNLIAITASYFLDLPTGHTVVALYAFTGITFAFVRRAGRLGREGRQEGAP